jgi:hypothetical protein
MCIFNVQRKAPTDGNWPGTVVRVNTLEMQRTSEEIVGLPSRLQVSAHAATPPELSSTALLPLTFWVSDSIGFH